ncbi:MAG: LCP family protein [Anaerolineaceae bacterium]|nr:LCP family protein [Anaerolineaceae bacterium]
MRKSVGVALLVFTLILGCTASPQTSLAPAGQAVSSRRIVTADPNASATPTPFQPAPPTATVTASATPEVTATLPPTEELYTPTPTGLGTLQMPEGITTIALLGSDERQGGGFRTDVILLLILNPEQKTASLVSFPRDLYVTLPYWGMNRINTAFIYGGFQMFADTMEYNFGIRPQHYILTNFNGFTSIIDSLGGIDVDAALNLNDKCDLPQNEAGYCSAGPGLVHMDGPTALWYVRSRYSTSDFDRTRRAQEAIAALFKSLLSVNAIERAPEIYAQYRSSVETDLSLDDILPAASLAVQIGQPENIHHYLITPAEAYPSYAENGAQVLIPNYEAIRQIILRASMGQ